MDKNQAIKLLIQAVEVAQLKGAYALKDAQAISIAVDTLNQEQKHDTSKPTGDNPETGGIEG